MPTALSIALAALTLTVLPTDIHVDPSANCAAGNGTAAAPFCTVAEALLAAVDGDRILVAAGQFPGPYAVTKDVTIVGAGDAIGGTAFTGTTSGTILRVEAGKTVTIDGVRLSGGRASDMTPGAIDNWGTLTLRNSTITNGTGSGWGACAIYHRDGSGTLMLDRCTLTNNYVNSGYGSLLRTRLGGEVTINGSSFHGNSQYHGPVIRAFGTTLRIDATTLSQNENFAGAVIQLSQSGLVMRNSTISSNFGRALFSNAAGGTQRLENCTIFRNGAGHVLHGIDSVGPSPVQLRNTIVAGGHPAGQTFQTVSGNFVSLGHNLVDNANGSTGLVDGNLGDIVGTAAAPVGADLGPLASGPTLGRTHMPNPSSPALDSGEPAAPLGFDQRGFPRIPGGADIGAVERPLGSAFVSCVPVPNSTGQPATAQGTGAITAATNRLRLLAADVPPGAMGYFLTSLDSASPGSVPIGSSGRLCLGGAIGRFSAPGQVQTASPSGTLGLNVNLQAMPQPTGIVAATAGQTWYFQTWFRDAVGGQATSNFSAAIGITWR